MSALSALWRGICAWVVRNPQYKKLFGPSASARTIRPVAQIDCDFLSDTAYQDFALRQAAQTFPLSAQQELCANSSPRAQ